ncbi:Rcs stress response system protein RcsF [Yersinia pseudotuberculosis]|uniref:Rcs stress response system protein RcsF n=1 Tax=Yersinia pseudotuberculosis TaxID=633 RepID=UPI0005E61A4F|nr:Rcs stress response system protein RcsF [Yersinia pseudotuberculosis]AXY34053.1 Rcs stress response system protein RcsF [Yersinia pseudotuberculosis]AYX09726.1 Rcs stress response system protein RcsF [Yersinia pseudotuberculosis]MBO1567574.1 Rcs stress response system protein RcsF [Yersinia pseudotuberculosis]MBO1590758.1 Rcs stress response system protein RcsF [Yersinia pseudotuberculosis]MBO1604433.1 Rcs stress response system protein RcsF [Yersinia pseudotuberculosis]
MRALPLCLLALSLTGCTLLPSKPSTTDNPIKQPPPVIERSPTATPRPAPVKLYKSAEELVGKPFRDLGEVSGESCQSTVQDSPPSISTARKRMQIRASYMKANAVLLHECEIQSGVPGCYQQAVCQGSALNVSSK